MGLINKAEAAAAAGDQAAATNTVEQGANASGDATAGQAAAAPASTAVAAKATAGALATARKVNMHVIQGLKDALPVDFNTLAQVQANQGKFKDKESDKNLGETIAIELMSWQDNWVVSPNDLKADKELVKYSDDGVTAKDGTNLLEHLEFLKTKYPKAKLQQRVVLVGALTDAEKDKSLVGQLVQIDCSPTSRSMFLRYVANAAWKLKTGALDEESVKQLRLTAAAAKGPDNSDYTRIDFATAT